MKKSILIILFPFIIFACISKNKNSIDENINEMFQKTVTYIDSLENVDNYNFKSDLYKLIIYIDSSDCTPCALDHVQIYKLYSEDLKNNYNTDIVLIAQNDDSEVIKDILTHLGIHFPLFLDTKGLFKEVNYIPDDFKYKTFLLDKQNKIIWIGSPVRSKESLELFKKMIKEL